MTKESIAAMMAQLFEGREGSVAIKMVIDGQKTYAPYRDKEGKDIPLTAELALRHLSGELSLGSYPLDKNNTVRWAAVDFDGKRGDPLADALKVKSNLASIGVISWLERSQSGKGIHLWAFFDKRYPARLVREVFAHNIPEFFVPADKRVTSYDRMFPNQDSAGGGYGNLCALPLNGADLVSKGNTAFLKEDGTPLPKQSETLWEIESLVNNFEVIAEEVKKNTKQIALPTRKALPVLNEVPGGTKLMAPQGCAWLRKCYKNAATLPEPEWYAALCQFAKVEQGDVLAHRFSQPHPKYDYNDTQKKFEHAKTEDKPMTCQTVWEQFGDCGKRCAHLGVRAPWQIATVSLSQLDTGNKGKIYDSTDSAQAGMEIIKDISSGKRLGFAWGYDLLDDHTELRPKNLVVVAARQGMGKTAVMIDASVRMALRGIPQYVFSIEMGYEQLSLRYLARLSGIDQSVMMTGRVGKQEMEKIEEAFALFKTLPIYIDDSTRELDRMLDNAGELTYKHGQGVIWIDYLQLVRRGKNETKKEAVDRFVDGYKQMSKIIDSPVVALAQLNRSEETSESPEDDFDSWLKDSGDIEQTADVIIYIRGQRGPGLIERRWRIHKERHRASGINFRFLFHQGTFKFEPNGYWNKRPVSDDDMSADEGMLDV